MKTGPSQERTPLSGIKVRTQLRICPPKTILLGVGDEIHDVFELEFLHYPIAMGFDRSRMQFHFLGDLLAREAINNEADDILFTPAQDFGESDGILSQLRTHLPYKRGEIVLASRDRSHRLF